jgi:MtfA peptidase
MVVGIVGCIVGFGTLVLMLADDLRALGMAAYRPWFFAVFAAILGASFLGGWLLERRWRDRRRRRVSPRIVEPGDGDRIAVTRPIEPEPIPPTWRRVLLGHGRHYARLPEPVRREFERQLHRFVTAAKITGIETEVTEELRLLVAASAVTLTAGWPGSAWTRLSEVLLYPKGFDDEYGFDAPEMAGQAHPWGIVVMSVPSLQASFRNHTDGYHVGIHEFMHLLDMGDGEVDGIPVGFGSARTEAWNRLRPREEKRLLRGRSVLSPYALTNPVEFLAVAAEAFFGIPVALRRGHRELYELLRDYFRQDPAAWESDSTPSGAAGVAEAPSTLRRQAPCARRRRAR